MNRQSGTYILQKNSGESYKAYLPASLPPHPPVDLPHLYPLMEKAIFALSELNAVTKLIPNTSLFIYMAVRKEALLSNQIEGTQSSFVDLILFEDHQKPYVALADVEEVSNYVKALNYGLNRLRGGFPLSLRLLREIHRVLLSGGRGSSKLPGEFRTSQNWIGGTKPGNALFVPPPPHEMTGCLFELEKFLHSESLPALIKSGLAHVQFETIHPFLDGNGRLGRLLITLMLCEGGMLDEPTLYLSLYLKQNRSLYYDLLQNVRLYGVWEEWLEFFLEGVFSSAKEGVKTAQKINKLFEDDLKKIESLGRARFSAVKILEYLKNLPQVSVQAVSQKLEMTDPTARNVLNQMVRLGILEETSLKKRDKVYVYRKYLSILEEGAEPFQI